MTTDMPRGTDAPWYEPPQPRDWKANPTALQRIESAANLRKSLLESAAKATISVPVRKNFQVDSPRDVSRSFENDISRSMVSLPTTPRAMGSHNNTGSAQSDLESSSSVQPSFARQMSASLRGSAMDLSSTFVFKNKIRSKQDTVDKILNTPPSRPRSSSMTKYEPLPAIRNSGSGLRRDPMDSNNNGGAMSTPPPLLRSRTFDVIETNMTNLPVVESEYDYTSMSDNDDDDTDDDSSEGGACSARSRSIKPFLEHEEFAEDAADSGVVSASSCNLTVDSREGGSGALRKGIQNAADNDSIFESDLVSGAVPVQVTIEGKPLSEYVSQIKMGALKSRPCTQYGRKGAGEGSPTPSDDLLSPDSTSEPIINAVDGMEEDIVVYIKMPDDTLMLISSPINRTLKELLSIVKGTNINGHCVVISKKGLNPSDLRKSLYDLGITDNTTLHLIKEE